MSRASWTASSRSRWRRGPGTSTGRRRPSRPSSRLSIDIARELGLADAEAVTIPTACAAGNYAIGYGFDAVADGEVDVALCGGVDALLRMTFVTFYRLGTIAPQTCQPFDRNRKGILTGEGGAMLVLEDLDSAVARGARIYAEVLGYGLACDAHHPVAPDQRSVARCIARAHANAGISPGQVDYISAHGTGTKANDVTEVAAIRQVFAGNTPPVSSLKSMLGHAMGAASALAAAGCALALDNGFIPPTINHTEDDPEIDIDCVPNVARQAQLRVVQNDSLAFAGNDAVLILGGHGKNAHGTGPRGPRGERRHDARGNDGAHVTAPVITAWETYSPLGHGASAHVAGLSGRPATPTGCGRRSRASRSARFSAGPAPGPWTAPPGGGRGDDPPAAGTGQHRRGAVRRLRSRGSRPGPRRERRGQRASWASSATPGPGTSPTTSTRPMCPGP